MGEDERQKTVKETEVMGEKMRCVKAIRLKNEISSGSGHEQLQRAMLGTPEDIRMVVAVDQPSRLCCPCIFRFSDPTGSVVYTSHSQRPKSMHREGHHGNALAAYLQQHKRCTVLKGQIQGHTLGSSNPTIQGEKTYALLL
jgi:hypothetical protein